LSPEQHARQAIDHLLRQAGWKVMDVAQADVHAGPGVALREFPLQGGYGFADYLLYVEGRAAGVIEAKKQGATLTGVEAQSARYAQGLPATLPAWRRPLPFVYESTGAETHFTNGLDPEPRARGPWRQVQEYFDAHCIGHAGAPNTQTSSFFNQNIGMEYGYPQPVANTLDVRDMTRPSAAPSAAELRSSRCWPKDTAALRSQRCRIWRRRTI
jgi:type I site-specific restriction endonuclease